MIPPLLIACAMLTAHPKPPTAFSVNPETGETQAQFASRTRWWRHARFGMFIHWGVYSVPAHGEWYMYNAKVPVDQYEKYAAQFDPVQFNAHTWVKIAKDAGMRYMVITSKHHDGFCMFDTKLTDYNIVKATPFHRDPMKELAAECRKQGVRLCFYHSIMDWHEPDYLPRRPWDTRPVDDASLDRYIRHMEGQLRELLTQYGPIGVIWFDGGWEHNADQLHSLDVVRTIRSLQPDILINNRADIPEDFDTPEQSIPASALPHGRLWETCMTINDNWGYNENDHNFKSSTDLIRKLCDIASKGGNFLLNVGPTAQGIIPAPEVDRLEAMGRWMRVNGASIYGTSKSPFRRLTFDGRCTSKGSALYFQVFTWPADGWISIPGLKTPVRSAQALGDHERLQVEPEPSGLLGVRISRPQRDIDPAATVVEVRLAGQPDVEEQPIVERPAADGSITLPAADANLTGNAQVETRGGVPNIGFWTDRTDTAAWTADVPAAGGYRVQIEYACPPEDAGSTYRVVAGTGSATGTVDATGDWATFRMATLPGTLNLAAGRQTIIVSADTMPHGAVMNLRRIVLARAP